MRTMIRACVACVWLATAAHAAEPGFPMDGVDGTTAQFAPLLAEHLVKTPGVHGAPSFADRAVWEAMAKTEFGKDAIKRADAWLDKDAPTLTDDLYLEFSRNGNRTRYEGAFFDLQRRLRWNTLAYLLTADGKYRDKLQSQLETFLSLKSWVLPAHDKNLNAFNDRRRFNDLGSVNLSSLVATSTRLLHDELPSELVGEVKANLRRRLFDPLRAMLEKKVLADSWITAKNNWNAVCWNDILETALAMLENPEERLYFVGHALANIDHSLQAFGKDGYCSEGISYWNYGFTRNLRFAAHLYFATSGRINLMELSSMRRPAFLPERLALVPDVYPAFADSAVNVRINWTALLMRDFLMDRATGIRARGGKPSAAQHLAEIFVVLAIPPLDGALEKDPPLPPLSRFEASGAAIVRPGPGSACRLSAAFKAGHNDELHNHNDLGSYVVAVDGVAVLFDPGAEVYSARTFGAQRYTSKLMNSYGHPVPVIAGELQRNGSDTDAKTLSEKSDDNTYEWRIDLAPAYGRPEVETLERTFRYSRVGDGKVEIMDTGDFKQPIAFETVLVTPGKFTELNETSGQITYNNKTLRVTVATEHPFAWVTEVLDEPARHKGPITRIALRLRDKVERTTIAVTCVPVK